MDHSVAFLKLEDQLGGWLVRRIQNRQGRESAKYARCSVIRRVWDTKMKLGREDPDRRHQRESVGVLKVPVVYFQIKFHYS